MTTMPVSRAPDRTVPDVTGILMHTAHVLNTRLSAALTEVGLLQREQCVLVHALGAERTQGQLAELSRMDKTTMVVTVDGLEKAGYAERRPSSTDRRARIIHVTEAGAEVAARGQEVVDRVHQEVLDALPAAQRDAFVAALEGLMAGPLAEPVPSDQPVRRARQARR
ncbi:MarR family winged helix-turn-helix transcriptional regulator [Streptomyces sp. CMB-StM0423]|uniref:MarR family winged helix-turn-helix transcriptional regulator n=1 Tax=Streptomyces sp. CMB-StM0423 TaxID=2059884 RepID=UPI000C702967|nr:MarR family transcriptional regulator [Streptomyces sp. CMB-StM0423]AUH40293.1 MarR family transcriptional regulator [Streptomyces sp. CMB-StM0423]